MLARKHSLKWPCNPRGVKGRIWSFKQRWSNTPYYLANSEANKPHSSGENVTEDRLQFWHRAHASYEVFEYMWSVEFSAFYFYCLSFKLKSVDFKGRAQRCWGRNQHQVAWMLPSRNCISAKRASRYEVDEESVSFACIDLDEHGLSTRILSVWHSSPSVH